jgi:hypothetical protein
VHEYIECEVAVHVELVGVIQRPELWKFDRVLMVWILVGGRRNPEVRSILVVMVEAIRPVGEGQ